MGSIKLNLGLSLGTFQVTFKRKRQPFEGDVLEIPVPKGKSDALCHNSRACGGGGCVDVLKRLENAANDDVNVAFYRYRSSAFHTVPRIRILAA